MNEEAGQYTADEAPADLHMSTADDLLAAAKDKSHVFVRAEHAVNYIMHGDFRGEPAEQPYLSVRTDDEDEADVAFEEGEIAGALRVLCSAIRKGTVSVYQVRHDERGSALYKIRPELFRENVYAEHNGIVGHVRSFTIVAGSGDEIDNPIFVPREIQTLADAAQDDGALSMPSGPRTRSKRGARAKPYGKAMAAFLEAAVAQGAHAVAAKPNKVLGNMLRDAYRNLGVAVLPTVEDAGRDAREILKAHIAAIS